MGVITGVKVKSCYMTFASFAFSHNMSREFGSMLTQRESYEWKRNSISLFPNIALGSV